MSASCYEDCPCCGEIEGVCLYSIYDFELTVDGMIENKFIHGTCTKCGKRFEAVKR